MNLGGTLAEEASNGLQNVDDVPLLGDSRCNPAFRVAAAWREIDGCLDGEADEGLSLLETREGSPSGDMWTLKWY